LYPWSPTQTQSVTLCLMRPKILTHDIGSKLLANIGIITILGGARFLCQKWILAGM
jgi:hypothetical protein